jgi:TfoX/Sxy family transcriptional regulator of competence genes
MSFVASEFLLAPLTMSTDQSFLDHVLDCLSPLPGVSHRRMFGEYALYLDGRVVALLCDNRIFLRPAPGTQSLTAALETGFPYPGAKLHAIGDALLDDPAQLIRILQVLARELPLPRQKAAARRKSGRSSSP